MVKAICFHADAELTPYSFFLYPSERTAGRRNALVGNVRRLNIKRMVCVLLL